jgi:hypothetical protein
MEFRLTSNPGIPENRDLAFCLRIPTLVSNSMNSLSAGRQITPSRSKLSHMASVRLKHVAGGVRPCVRALQKGIAQVGPFFCH